MLLLLASSFARAACETAVSTARIGDTLADATLAWVQADEVGFRELASRVEAELPCVDGALNSSQAASFHRVVGLHAFLDGRSQQALLSFRAARGIEPETQLSERIAPPGGPLATIYASALVEGTSTPFALRDGYAAWVDGRPSLSYPDDRPTIVQIGRTDQSLSATFLLAPRQSLELPADALPTLKSPEERVAVVVEEEAPAAAPTRKKGAATGLWVATGVGALAAGGLFAASAVTNSEFAVQPSEELLTTNHVTYIGSLGMAGVTVVLASVALVVSF